MDSQYRFNPFRLLFDRERELTRWIIEHGDASSEDQGKYIAQLAEATVASQCPCGCASVGFAINGREAPCEAGLEILGDFVCDGAGVFVFAKNGLLAGIEIYQLGDEKIRRELPQPSELKPIGDDRTRDADG
jgi:hypothetical protein